jgi:hypothetical protein
MPIRKTKLSCLKKIKTLFPLHGSGRPLSLQWMLSGQTRMTNPKNVKVPITDGCRTIKGGKEEKKEKKTNAALRGKKSRRLFQKDTRLATAESRPSQGGKEAAKH